MLKEMQQIKVTINKKDGLIYIVQGIGVPEEDSVVVIHPEQIDILYKWLQQAANELIQA